MKSLVLPLLFLLWVTTALAHDDTAAFKAAVSLDDDGAESPWREASAPTARTRNKPAHASQAAAGPKDERILQQQQQQQQTPTRRPTRSPTRRPTRKPTQGPTSAPKQLPTAAPTRRPPPHPTSVVLGGRSFDRLSILAASAVIGVGLVAVLVVVAYWCCCRRATKACVVSLCPNNRRRSTANTTGGNGNGGQHLAVASLYYDGDERYRPLHTPPQQRGGTLLGQAVAVDPISLPPPQPVRHPPLSPPASPRFDPFGRAAIEYMGAAGVWPPTPERAHQQGQQHQDEDEGDDDDYAELVRLLTTTTTTDGGEEGEASVALALAALHPDDLRMEMLPFSFSHSGNMARYRGRMGCTLPPPPPVVAVACPVGEAPATDSTRDLGVVNTGEEEEEEEEGGKGEGEGELGAPVVISVHHRPIPLGAAQSVHRRLCRLKVVTATYPRLFLPLLGVCCRGAKRRVAVVEGAWPAGRPVGEAVQAEPPHHGSSSSTGHKKRAPFLRIGVQVAEALLRLHEAGLSHGELRPTHVLVERRTLQAKLSNARVFDDMEVVRAADGAGDEEEDEEAASYLAPECWADNNSTSAPRDVYALAVLLWGIWAGQRPYAGMGLSGQELREAVCMRGLRPTSAAASVAWAGTASESVEELPASFETLLTEMWAPQPEARPGVGVVLARLRALLAAMD